MEENGIRSEEMAVYSRILVNGSEFRATEKTTGRSDNRFLITRNDDFFFIKKIVVFDNPEICGLFGVLLGVNNTLVHAKYIAVLNDDYDENFFITSNDIKSPAIKISLIANCYVLPISNRFEID